jgi:hypothetical protein
VIALTVWPTAAVDVADRLNVREDSLAIRANVDLGVPLLVVLALLLLHCLEVTNQDKPTPRSRKQDIKSLGLSRRANAMEWLVPNTTTMMSFSRPW